MKLKLSELNNSAAWQSAGIGLPSFDRAAMIQRTKASPRWIHFGAGNIFRAFPAAVLQTLLDKGAEDTGLIVAEGFDTEIIDRVYKPCDDLSLLVTLRGDGTVDKRIIASIAESLTMERSRAADWNRLTEIFQSPSLQMASFTITEKGYQLQDASGRYFGQMEADLAAGPQAAESYMGKVAALCYARYQAGGRPLALVSMDNFSHNGDRLKDAVIAFAEGWAEKDLADKGFLTWLQDAQRVSFPWTMIDKITPRPDPKIQAMLEADGLENMKPVVTEKHTYIAPFVNAEECEYLVIEDWFPAGRPALDAGGMIFTDRETVDKVERMKVCTCLNPLHTALAVFGCLLSYEKISDEMQDPQLRRLVFDLGYKEGLPVVTDPGILDPEEFLKQVLTVRIPNPFMPDTPQRIATDTSQKISIRFGETIKAYLADPDRDTGMLTLVPLVLAGWLRYLLGVDDQGTAFTVSPDPLYEELKGQLAGITLGEAADTASKLAPILENEKLFGVNLFDAGLAEQVIAYFDEMTAGPGAVRNVLKKYVTE